MSLSAAQRAAFASAPCEVAFDNLTRQLYATDASLYQVEPLAVAFPRGATQAARVIQAAAEGGLTVIPRGAGTGLTGGAIGAGLVVDFSRDNRQITNLDLERRTVRVGAGVVLDQLNLFLKPHGFCFGPDVATSSRATLGGMIANNSSGSYAPVYGVTADHVVSCEIVLADGRVLEAGPEGGARFQPAMDSLEQLIRPHAAEIRERFPPVLNKRWPGYGLDRWVRGPASLAHLLAGSEGTLAAITSAQLGLVPLPRQKGLGCIFFASVSEALQATVELLDLKPAAIEHIDRVLFDQTREQRAFQPARDLLQLDTLPCESFLLVEFFDEAVAARLEAMSARKLGLRTQVLQSAAEQALVWNLRKAGLSLITGRPGAAKPVTCIEDTAVLPVRLPEYVKGLQSILGRRGLEVCLYGHAASGLLHVRPVLDLHTAEGRRHLREVSAEVSALVRQFGGSLCAEHGVGMARTEFMLDHLGAPLLELHRQIKQVFDPRRVFNPGKIIPEAGFDYRLDTRLRGSPPSSPLALPFAPVLAFAAKDHSFIGNLEQCNGCGGCRKDTPTMCPTFSATGQELMSTRGRANLIRAVLEGRCAESGAGLRAPELEAALSNCLSCKACATECPSNVNLPLLKAELLHARHRRDGVPALAQIVSHVDWLGRLGCLVPSLANATLEVRWLRRLLQMWLGLSASRPLPRYAHERFDHWFGRRRVAPLSPPPRGRVILWDDTFVRYHEPHIGHAAVAVLEAAGFEVVLLKDRACCGRPAMSQGHLEEAMRLGRHNLARLNAEAGAPPLLPLIFLEPSCWSMFVEDYRELKLPGAEQVAPRCFLFEQFLDDLLKREPDALRFNHVAANLAIHAHCHAKALANPAQATRMLGRLPGRKATLLATGCCGMAGAFGTMESKQALSRQVAEPLVEQIKRQPQNTILVASGTSCRHQIRYLTDATPRHAAEVLAEALASGASP